MLDSGMPGSAWCMFVATRYRHRNFPSTNILGCCGLLYGSRLPGFGVLHSVLRDETTVIRRERTAPTRQYSDRRALNGTVIVTDGEDLKPRLTGDGLAATQG
jgi:hypothetical protein